jgi:predicted Fe-Mo cluster-binding NifX family protein
MLKMKIAISSTGKDLDAQVDPRFGRCQYFIIVEPKSLEYKVFENPNIDAAGGAGIQSGRMMADNGVKAVLTGNVGPNAFQTLNAAKVEIITGVSGTVREAVQRYNNGEFQSTKEATVADHFGMASGGGASNPGMGTGMGRGRGMGRGSMASSVGQQQMSPDQELQMLKGQAEAMKQELDMMNNRIKELENR